MDDRDAIPAFTIGIVRSQASYARHKKDSLAKPKQGLRDGSLLFFMLLVLAQVGH